MSSCAHCFRGVSHSGTPVGQLVKIGGFDTYVSKPEGNFPKDKAVLFLADVFGIQMNNSKLLADDFARNGFQVYAPDYLYGDPVPDGALNSPTFDGPAWFARHTQKRTRPVLDAVVKALKEQGVTSLAAVGYCFGGRYVFDLAFDNVIQVAATSHPSQLKVPDDLQKLLAVSRSPLLINTSEIDQQYPIVFQLKGDEILGGGKYKPGYQKIFWPGTTHGFAVRGDLSKPEVKAAKEGAFKATVEFFRLHFYGETRSRL
ncbi:Alpha/Beta hydrolase protein [Gautieria morchelliformis]|nr:Alpha/Beta hydrolase protein [Gautieria morchelliformis]